jgi:hypothetical protein
MDFGQWAVTEPALLRGFDRALYLGVVLAPPGLLALAQDLTGHGERLTRRLLALLAVEPLAVQLVLWTPDLGHLFLARLQVQPGSPVELAVTYGPLFWVHSFYSYALILWRSSPSPGPGATLRPCCAASSASCWPPPFPRSWPTA